MIANAAARYLGRFTAAGANKPDHLVEADVFHVPVQHHPWARSETEEAVWVSAAGVARKRFAPITREHILPLVRIL